METKRTEVPLHRTLFIMCAVTEDDDLAQAEAEIAARMAQAEAEIAARGMLNSAELEMPTR